MVINIVITAWAGYHMASSAWDGQTLVYCLVGTAILAAAAFCFNQGLEKGPDAKMDRTASRPVPTDRISLRATYWGGAGLTLSGTLLLAWGCNPTTAALGLATVLLYAAVYTPMKRMSSLNTLVGAIPGAIPPVMGWAAAGASPWGGGALALFSLLFFWQLPHFLAIAWMHKDDYAKGGFRMLSVDDPSGDACFRQIRIQTLLLVLVSWIPWWLGMAGSIYVITATLAGGFFLLEAWKSGKKRDRESARKLFMVSLLYLPVVLLALSLDKIS
jgi:protoheme IX farnesyltransferase